jgi:hypothetical protein
MLPSRAGPLRPDLTAFGEEGSGVEGSGVRHATERDWEIAAFGQRQTLPPQ